MGVQRVADPLVGQGQSPCGDWGEAPESPNWASGLVLGWVRLSNQTPSPEGTPEGFACAAGRVGAAMPRGRVNGHR